LTLVVLPLPTCTPATLENLIQHIVVISLDTTRADHFGFAGNEWIRTPNLDAFAKRAIVFDNYITVVPTTLASHATLFTGKYPHNHGVPRNGYAIPPENVMLPEILQESGFHTAGFIASVVLDSRFGFHQGFDHFDNESGTYRPGEEITDAAIRYLDTLEGNKRLFLFAHYYDPHQPYEAPAPYQTQYDPDGLEGLPPLAKVIGRGEFSRAQKDDFAGRYAKQYASEISYMDEHIGRLLDDLERRGILDRALVVITSDHGENLWNHPDFFNHGVTVFETVTRCVGMIRLPAGPAYPARVDGVVASIDFMPTVLKAIGVTAPADIDGESLDLETIGDGFPARVRFGQATKPRSRSIEEGQLWRNQQKARFIRDGRFKFVQTPYRDTEELYDLESDPGETQNLLENSTHAHGALAAELRSHLEFWAASGAGLTTEETQDPETLEKLRSLGYIK